jgi:hypothetical protein
MQTTSSSPAQTATGTSPTRCPGSTVRPALKKDVGGMAEKRQVEREARRVERAKRRAALVTVTEKKCPCCHQVLNSDAFPIDVTKPDHLTTMCGICKRTGRNKTPRLQDECKHCHAVKPIEEFELRTGRIKRGRVCRECRLYYLKTKHKE